jgi:hypothetical protein
MVQGGAVRLTRPRDLAHDPSWVTIIRARAGGATPRLSWTSRPRLLPKITSVAGGCGGKSPGRARLIGQVKGKGVEPEVPVPEATRTDQGATIVVTDGAEKG